jgi:hypothetical protein
MSFVNMYPPCGQGRGWDREAAPLMKQDVVIRPDPGITRVLLLTISVRFLQPL